MVSPTSHGTACGACLTPPRIASKSVNVATASANNCAAPRRAVVPTARGQDRTPNEQSWSRQCRPHIALRYRQHVTPRRISSRGEAAAINHRMYLAGETTPRPSHGLSLFAGDAGGVLMNARNRGVDHLDGSIMSSSQSVHDPAPNVSPTPTNEAIVASGVRAERLRQIAPRCAGSQDQKMPFRTRRSLPRGTPRGLFGSIGLMAAHSWSVSS
jgi:hypothetical protein